MELAKFKLEKPYGGEVEVVIDTSLVEIDDSALDEAYTKHAGILAWWLSLEAWARYSVDKTKVELDAFIAQKAEMVRDILLNEKGKATEAMVANAVASDPDVVKAKQRLKEEEMKLSLISAMTKALSSRTHMLVSYGSLLRATTIDPTVLEAQIGASPLRGTEGVKKQLKEYTESVKAGLGK